MTKVKICGIRSVEHALVALEHDADLLGFIFYPPSHRYLPPEQAGRIVERCRERFPSGWSAVGVFVNVALDELHDAARRARLDLVQLAGDEDGEYCQRVQLPVVKVVRVDVQGRPGGPTEAAAWGAQRVLLDTERAGAWGGTGESYDWQAVRPFAGQALLAGGLTPANVAQAVRQAQPWGVDVSSGVERGRVKDPKLIRQFLEEVKQYDPVH